MPPRLASPVLTVDAGKIAKVDPRNVENLFGMWTESLEEGRRLENLSWRLWNRETFCCEPEDYSTTTQRNQRKSRRDPDDIPELSVSVDSAASDEMEHIESHTKTVSGAVDIKRPPLPRRESTESRSRGKEKHITSLHLERMVMTIKEKKDLEPLSPRRSTAPARAAQGTTDTTTPRPPTTPTVTKPSLPTTITTITTTTTTNSESESAVSQCVSSESSAISDALSGHSIVRGFSPGHVSSSYRSHTRLAPVVPRPPHVQVEVNNKKKAGTIFMLGTSSGEEESSLEEHMSTTFHLQQQQQRSSLSEGLKKPQRKRTSFKDDVTTRTVYEGAQEDDVADTEEDEEVVSESAIDDDDSSDWEDSVTESGRSSVNEKEMFQRVDSRPNLTTRRSLLSTLLHQPDRAAALQNAASRSTPAMRSRTSSPNGPSVSATPEEESALTMRGPQIPRSRPIVMTTPSIHPPALSPRTTRRNMLATELTESLRRHLLWERQQKNTTASAVLKRRHTSHDVSNLHEYPGQDMNSPSKDASKNNSWNYFDHGLGEYHQKGW
ncbi:hypothetical protein GP486_007875 [Trichoglossum hirsutum]|uniref:Nitrogen regulatory protein areA GATA-like domain-containing protein n=1 Tax=Trichoglossum hirsutum TaxID=265104 RepID=A0A9P8IB07_9PEZI|nr:hypothetical protein GP486_007875 [Trichoglossum hirsutum]